MNFIVEVLGDNLMDKIFVSFVEEAVLNPEYEGYIGGRIEVRLPEDIAFHSEEIRFFTSHIKDFYRFRDTWDMRYVTEEQLNTIRDVVKEKFYGKINAL